MSTAYSGVDGKCLDGTTDYDVTGFQCEVSDDGFESTTTADAGWQDMLDSVRKVSGSFDFFFNSAKNPFIAPLNYFKRPSVYPTLKLFTNATQFLTGVAKIKKMSIKSATKEGITYTCTFESKGAWTLPV